MKFCLFSTIIESSRILYSPLTTCLSFISGSSSRHTAHHTFFLILFFFIFHLLRWSTSVAHNPLLMANRQATHHATNQNWMQQMQLPLHFIQHIVVLRILSRSITAKDSKVQQREQVNVLVAAHHASQHKSLLNRFTTLTQSLNAC